jgi:glycosyltransferase involved in cell wall biosynthesis
VNENIIVSICCITYNHEKNIREALEGFLKQKTTFPFEILIHDDASKDKTVIIIKEYQVKYPKLIKPIYQQTNQYSKGIGINVTYQFPRASGKYIAICEGDDYWTDPYKLQKQVDFLEANPKYSAVGHQTKIIYENTPGEKNYFYTLNMNILKKKDIYYSYNIHTNAILFKRDAIIKYDLKDVRNLVEHALFILIVQSGKFRVLPEVMSVYRRHDYGITGTTTPLKAYSAQIVWISEVYKILGWRFYWGYNYLTSRVHCYYAFNHKELFKGGAILRSYLFIKYAILSLLIYPRNIRSVFRTIQR